MKILLQNKYIVLQHNSFFFFLVFYFRNAKTLHFAKEQL